jgi:hypothetical protein
MKKRIPGKALAAKDAASKKQEPTSADIARLHRKIGAAEEAGKDTPAQNKNLGLSR